MKRVLALLFCIAVLLSTVPVNSSADYHYTDYKYSKQYQADERTVFYKCLQDACKYKVYDGAKTQREGQWAFYVEGLHDINNAVANAMKNAGLNYQYQVKQWSNYGKQRTYVNVYLR